jgi:hypothetical protein
MAGWVYLPRFVDKIRLHLTGRLPKDYQENFAKGFDAAWCKAAGVTPEQVIEVVKNSITDGEVCDWVLKNIQKSAEEKTAFAKFILNRGNDGDPATKERLETRKRENGLAHRADIQTFVDMIDADEKRI